MKVHSLARWVILGWAVGGWAWTAAAAPRYWGGGEVDATDGTPLPVSTNGLSGFWNTTTLNWGADHLGTAYGAFASGDLAILGAFTASVNDAKAIIRLQADVTLSGLIATLQSPVGFRSGYIISNDVAQTLTPAGTACTFTIVASDFTDEVRLHSTISLSGSAPLTKAGAGQLSLSAANTNYTGALLVQGGTLKLAGLGDYPAGVGGLPGVTSLLVRGFSNPAGGNYDNSYFATPSLTVVADGNGACNQLHDGAVITLARGRLEYQGRRNNDPASASVETIRQLVLAPHGSLDVDSAGAGGSQAGRLILADPTNGLSRGADGLGTPPPTRWKPFPPPRPRRISPPGRPTAITGSGWAPTPSPPPANWAISPCARWASTPTATPTCPSAAGTPSPSPPAPSPSSP